MTMHPAEEIKFLRELATSLTARVKELEEALRDVDAECTAAIAHVPIPAGYSNPDDVPNGLRTVYHIKFGMIREYARAALNPTPSPWRPVTTEAKTATLDWNAPHPRLRREESDGKPRKPRTASFAR